MYDPTNIDPVSTLGSCFGADLGSSVLVTRDCAIFAVGIGFKMYFGKVGVPLIWVLSIFLTGHVVMDFRDNPAYFEDTTCLEFLSRILYLMLFNEKK